MNILNLVDKGIGIISTIFVGRLVGVLLIALSLVVFSFYGGTRELYKLSDVYDFDQRAYIVSASDCLTMINAESGKILNQRKIVGWPETHYKCFTGTHSDMIKLSDEFKLNSRATNNNSFIFYYLSAFILFCLSVILTLGNAEVPHISASLSRTNITVAWIFICIMLFPLTFSDYKSSASVTVNGQSYLVENIFISKDGTKYIKLPYNTVGKILSASGAVQYNIDDMY